MNGVIEFLTGFRDVLILIFGAGFGFVLARIQVWLDRKRRRRAVSTTLLTELRWLDHVLRQMVLGGPTAYDALLHPTLQAALPNVHLFNPETAEKLVHFHALLRDVQESTRYFAADPRHQKQTYRYEIKCKATYACQAVPPLIGALVKDGGVKPGSLSGEEVARGELPQLPPAPFGEPRFTEGTQNIDT